MPTNITKGYPWPPQPDDQNKNGAKGKAKENPQPPPLPVSPPPLPSSPPGRKPIKAQPTDQGANVQEAASPVMTPAGRGKTFVPPPPRREAVPPPQRPPGPPPLPKTSPPPIPQAAIPKPTPPPTAPPLHRFNGGVSKKEKQVRFDDAVKAEDGSGLPKTLPSPRAGRPPPLPPYPKDLERITQEPLSLPTSSPRKDPELGPPEERIAPPLPPKGSAYGEKIKELYGSSDDQAMAKRAEAFVDSKQRQSQAAGSKGSRARMRPGVNQPTRALNTALVGLEPNTPLSGLRLDDLQSVQLINSTETDFVEKINNNVDSLNESRAIRSKNTLWKRFCLVLSPFAIGSGTTLIAAALTATILIMSSNPFTLALGIALMLVGIAAGVQAYRTRKIAKSEGNLVKDYEKRLGVQLEHAVTVHELLQRDVRASSDTAVRSYLVQQQSVYFELIKLIKEAIKNPEMVMASELKAREKVGRIVIEPREGRDPLSQFCQAAAISTLMS